MISKIRQIQSIIRDHRKNKYLSYKQCFVNIYKNKKTKYQIRSIDFYKKHKTSNTIFILGNGPSLNLLEQSHLATINSNNSFGVANSFLKKEIIPTYHLFSWENDYISLNVKAKNFSQYRKSYQDTIMMLNSKALFRLSHPLTTDFMFPQNPKCCFFWEQKAITIHEDRLFTDNDFTESLAYRGTLSVVLDLAVKLNYTNIILLGVNLDSWEYFYQHMPEMKEVLAKTYESAHGVKNVTEEKMQYVGMYTRDGKPHTLDSYLYAVKDYLQRKKNINLFIDFKNNSLYPKLPAYFDTE